LSFSPDGKWIAAVGEREVNIISVDGITARNRVIRLFKRTATTIGDPGVRWAAGSQYLAIHVVRSEGTLEGGAIIIRVSTERQCEIPQEVRELGGFFTDRQIVVSRSLHPTKGYTVNSSPVSVYNVECGLETTWDFRGRIDYLEGLAPLGIAALIPDQSEVRIVNPITGEEKHRFRIIVGSGSLHFGNLGTVLCAGRYPSMGPLVCYDVRSAKLIGRHPNILGGSPLDVSLNDMIVLASDGSSYGSAFTKRRGNTLKAWVVWDVRTGRDLVRLKYRTQRRSASPAFSFEIPFASAISPDGRSFAIAGDGALSLYAIPR
jgi:hypothetical protein